MYTAYFLPLLATLGATLPTAEDYSLDIAKAIVARAPPEAKAVLKSTTSTGTGCGPNSAAFLINDNATVAFDAMVVESTSKDLSKKCLITIDLQLDPKWKYTINKASDIRGYIDHGNAKIKVLYTVGGDSSEVNGDINAATKQDYSYVFHSTSPGATSAPGGGVATIDVQVRLLPEAGTASAVTVDSIDIGFNYAKA
ncbi:uncharacterized protein BDR25DRAFT_375720 [Lindgomyces ingoldianus]|uniref:Uncharacterized protein n=1 Tax=Lindgomyces ingoldianus TaxID=673940 RepID=A0ACB6RBL9_9PLEO|nr:uncharacterized protein BDR25DRAFT_375720 [Lindgomyces ingoldianus]KAF2476669.1 hypothetical protein BDR25DRAFT_375720 [Lindgomyces ingoldianus]